MSSRKPPKAEIVGDLETLHSLLDETNNPTLDLFAPISAAPPEAQSLHDTAPAKQPGSSQETTLDPSPTNQSVDTGPTPLADSPPTTTPPGPELASNDDLFDTLLGNDWLEASEALLQTTSATIQEQQLDWNPDDTQALTDALRTRLSHTVNQWLETLLQANAGSLRQQLVTAMTDELAQRVQQTLDTNSTGRQAKEAALQKLAPKL